MGDAYTPGLVVTERTQVRKVRRLPLAGEVVVAVGAKVQAADVVARTALPGRVHMDNWANALGVLPDELAAHLRLACGDAVAAGQCVAERASLWGLLRARVYSQHAGILESVSGVTGVAVVREAPIPVEIQAYIDGEIVEVLANEGVIVQAEGALVQGIFGLAGERQGPIVVLAKSPAQTIDAADLAPSHAGCVLIGGGRLTLAGFRAALAHGVAAVVCGGFAYQDVKDLLGYDVGVAVTGTENLATTLVVTEGFGDIAMAQATYALLTSLAGAQASVNGATQIRAGVIRPEVVVPLSARPSQPAAVVAPGFVVGAPVRCIRAPYFGQIGTIVALPVELVAMPSETKVRVAHVQLADQLVVVPRANVEVIER